MSATELPTSVQEAIWEAAEQAIDCGVSPNDFRRELLQAWLDYLSERYRRDREDAQKTF